MLPLSELVALIQFEVQKSFEFSEQLMFELSGSNASVLQLAVDAVELDLPVTFSLGDGPAEAASTGTATKANLVLQRLDAPFLGRLTAEALREPAIDRDGAGLGATKKSRLSTKGASAKKATQLLVAVGADATGAVDGQMPQQIGRLKLVLRPVLK